MLIGGGLGCDQSSYDDKAQDEQRDAMKRPQPPGRIQQRGTRVPPRSSSCVFRANFRWLRPPPHLSSNAQPLVGLARHRSARCPNGAIGRRMTRREFSPARMTTAGAIETKAAKLQQRTSKCRDLPAAPPNTLKRWTSTEAHEKRSAAANRAKRGCLRGPGPCK